MIPADAVHSHRMPRQNLNWPGVPPIPDVDLLFEKQKT